MRPDDGYCLGTSSLALTLAGGVDPYGRELRVPRSRGALNGVLLVLLGLWGGLIAFVGPYFHYAYTPDQGFTYTTGRLWLEILPRPPAPLSAA